MTNRPLNNSFVVLPVNEATGLRVAIENDLSWDEWEGDQTLSAFLVDANDMAESEPVSTLTIRGHDWVVEHFETAPSYQQKGIMKALFCWLNEEWNCNPAFNTNEKQEGSSSHLSEEGAAAATELTKGGFASFHRDEAPYKDEEDY